MAKAVIIDIKPGYTGSINSVDHSAISVSGELHSAKITDIVHSAKAETVDYSIATIAGDYHSATISSILPFFVKITNIGIEGGYGPNNPAPIGIAIIGYSNYIL